MKDFNPQTNPQVDTVKALKLVGEISYIASNLTYMRSPQDIPGNIPNKNEVFQNVKKFIQNIQKTTNQFLDSGLMQQGPRHDRERVIRNLGAIKMFASQIIPYAKMLRDNYVHHYLHKYIRNLSYLDEKVSHSPIQILGPLW